MKIYTYRRFRVIIICMNAISVKQALLLLSHFQDTQSDDGYLLCIFMYVILSPATLLTQSKQHFSARRKSP